MPRAPAEVVVAVIGTAGVDVVGVVSVDAVVVAGTGVVTVLVDVDAEEVVVGALVVVSVVVGGDSARAAATPVAKSNAATKAAISFLSGMGRIIVPNGPALTKA